MVLISVQTSFTKETKMPQLFIIPNGNNLKEIATSLANKSEHTFGVMSEIAGNCGTISIQVSSLDEGGNFRGVLKNLKLHIPWDEPLDGKPVSGFICPVDKFGGVLNVED